MRFDRDYYRRYYYDPRTAVATRARDARARPPDRRPHRARRPAGAAHPRSRLRHRPAARARSRACCRARATSALESERVSVPALRLGSAAASRSYRARAPFDLVICYDVLQYLERRRRRARARELRRGCAAACCTSARSPAGDFAHNCDPRRTDTDVHLRSARWYRAAPARRGSARRAWASGCGAARRSRSGSWSRSERLARLRAAALRRNSG